MPSRSIAAAKCSGVGSGWRPPAVVGGPARSSSMSAQTAPAMWPGVVGGTAGATVEVPADVDDAHLVEVGGEPVGADQRAGKAIGHRTILRERASRRSQRGAARPRRSGPARRDRARRRGPAAAAAARRPSRNTSSSRVSSRRSADSHSSAGRNSKKGMCGVTIARCAATATEMPVFQACGTTSRSCRRPGRRRGAPPSARRRGRRRAARPAPRRARAARGTRARRGQPLAGGDRAPASAPRARA